MIKPRAIFASNPIISREVRSRWRGRAWTYVFAYSLLLSVTLGGFYYFLAGEETPKFYGVHNFRAGGQILFRVVSYLQILAIMLIAPAQTATAIVSEREQGMLEAMQLTPLPPWRIIVGKLLSVFFFLVMMLLVPLPIIAICFMLGGVSPGEFGLVLLLQMMTALTCAIIGLACSARSRRSGAALFLSFFWTLCWLVGSWLVSLSTGYLLMWASGIGSAAPPSSFSWLNILAGLFDLIFQTNPVFAVIAVLDADFAARYIFSTATEPAAICLIFQVLLSLLLLWAATRAVRKPLLAPGEQRGQRPRKVNIASARKALPKAKVPVPATPANPSILYRPITYHPPRLPLHAWLSFANPVLQREVRARFQMKPAPRWLVVAGVIPVILGVGCYYLLLLRVWLYPHEMMEWQALILLGMMLWMLAAAVMGAMAFTREREGRTWESLRLSLMQPHEIIRGKAAAIALTCLIYTAPFWPFMLTWLLRFALDPPLQEDGRSYMYGLSNSAVALGWVVAVLTIFAAAVWFSAACGMIFSWFHRTTPAAVGWSITTLVFTALVSLMGPSAWARYIPEEHTTLFMQLCQPVAAMVGLIQATLGSSFVGGNSFPLLSMLPPLPPWLQIFWPSIVSATTIFFIGQLLLGIVRHDMKRRIDREVSPS